MRRIGSQNRETLAEADTKVIQFRNGELITINSDGQIELWQMNDHVSGYCLEFNGVGYEFTRSISVEDLYHLLPSKGAAK
jgi:hypothetical protein